MHQAPQQFTGQPAYYPPQPNVYSPPVNNGVPHMQPHGAHTPVQTGYGYNNNQQQQYSRQDFNQSPQQPYNTFANVPPKQNSGGFDPFSPSHENTSSPVTVQPGHAASQFTDMVDSFKSQLNVKEPVQPKNTVHPDSEVEYAMNHILGTLVNDLRQVSGGLGAHSKYLEDLQVWANTADEQLRNERLLHQQAEENLEKAQVSLRKEWEMRVAAEELAKKHLARIHELEEKIKKGYDAYNTLYQDNQNLYNQLLSARSASEGNAEQLRAQRAARERLDTMLQDAKKRGMNDEQIVEMLERALTDETDKEFVSIIKLQITRLKKLIQEQSDVYLAYQLQHGDDSVTASSEVQKRIQEEKDAELARQMQAQENNAVRQPAQPQQYPYANNQSRNQYLGSTPPRPAQQQQQPPQKVNYGTAKKSSFFRL